MKKKTLLIILIVTILFCFLLVVRFRQKTPLIVVPDNELVESITTIKEYGKSLDWSPQTNLIAFGTPGQDGYWDVSLMNPDGSNERCLTCNKEAVPQKHNGNPAWHPSGKWIVFTAENPSLSNEYDQYAIPGSGFGCDLWLTDQNGNQFYKLTDYPLTQPFQAVIHPQFSHDGQKILWAERIDQGTNFNGTWILKLADFAQAPRPHLENIQSLDPGNQPSIYESHTFSLDDKKIMFSGNLEKGQSPVGLDIWEYNLETKKLKNLTNTFDDWDEHSHWSPDSTKIAWMSSTGFKINYENPPDKNWQKHLQTELWLMNADGSNRQRLTFFNDPGSEEYLDRAIVSDSSWGPEGKKLTVLVAYQAPGRKMKSKIVIIELE